MVRGTAPTAGALPEHVEQPARQRAGPAVAVAEEVVELHAQALDVLGRQLLGLGTEHAVEQRDRLGQTGCELGIGLHGARCGRSQLELKLPVLRRVFDADAAQVQRADFGERGLQPHGNVPPAGRGLGRRHDGGDGRQAVQRVSDEGQHGADGGRRAGFHGRRRQMEAHGLAQAQGEGAIGQRQHAARLAAPRQQADGLHRLGTFVQQQVNAARRPAADARCPSLARQRVRDGATGHGHIRVVVVQQPRGYTAAPVGQRLQQPLRQCVGAEHPAVE